MVFLFSEVAKGILERAKTEGRLSTGMDKITGLALLDQTTCSSRNTADVLTSFKNHAYTTKVTSRSAAQTRVFFSKPERYAGDMVSAVKKYLEEEKVELLYIDRQMGTHKRHSTVCRTVVTTPYARLLNMWDKLLFKPEEGRSPDQILFQIPEWEEVAPKYIPDWCSAQRETGKPLRRILVDADAGVTFVLGSDYFGEIKKGHLRMAMYKEKVKYRESNGVKGGLGVHAGGKVIRVKRKDTGEIKGLGTLFFGLSGTGKTSLSVHHFWLESGGERVIIRQDDFFVLDKDAKAYGTEDNAYIKTEGLEPEGQPLLYQGAVSDSAVLENVFVDPVTREADFFRYDHPFTPSKKCLNGRGIVIRNELVDNGVKQADENIDLESVDLVFFITRRDTVVPPVARLSEIQAASFFMLGESVLTSAADPVRAGQSVREVGTNPFIVGPHAEEGNIFHKMCKANPNMKCFLLNTGSFGGRTVKLSEKKLSEKSAEESVERFSKGIEHPRAGERIIQEFNGKKIEYKLKLVKTMLVFEGEEIRDPKSIEKKLSEIKEGKINKEDFIVKEYGMLEADKINVKDSCAIIREIARGAVKWKEDKDWGYEVAVDIPGVDMKRFDWRSYYSEDEYKEMTDVLRKERIEWLHKFPGLEKEIIDAIK